MQELEGQLKSVNEELKMVQKVGTTCTPISMQTILKYHITLCIQQQGREEQHQTLSAKIAKIEELERDLEVQRNEMEAERLSKERELRKMITKREKEVAELKKQLASIKQELEKENTSLPMCNK